MPVERTSGGTSLIDVLDRVLDKGIVIDAWVRVSLVGIDLITVEARVVVASIDTYLKYSEAVGSVAAGVQAGRRSPEAVMAENAALRAQLAASERNGAPAPPSPPDGQGLRPRPPRPWPPRGRERLGPAPRPQPVGGADRRLELLEALLMAAHPEECAQRALAWLQRHAGIRRGICLATAHR